MMIQVYITKSLCYNNIKLKQSLTTGYNIITGILLLLIHEISFPKMKYINNLATLASTKMPQIATLTCFFTKSYIL